LVVMANVRRTQCDSTAFRNMIQKDFEMKLLPQSLLHPDFRGDGEGSCLIHVLRRKEVSNERKQEKEVRRGVQAAKSDEPHQGQQKGTPNSSTSITSASEREDAVVSFPSYDKMKYRELQSLCKQRGIKANERRQFLWRHSSTGMPARNPRSSDLCR